MAAFWRLSNQVVFDNNARLAVGARASFFATGTTTPLVTYSDGALTTPNPDPVRADGAGRWPNVFFPVGPSYKERVETSSGSLLWEADNIDPAPSVSSGGGGGGGTVVDPLDLLDTGWIQPFFQTGTRDGWARCNGRSIGSAASSGSERANDDCEDLFTYLWNSDTGIGALTVSTGRGATAAADWAANKTITLPDLRSKALFGLSDMGNSTDTGLAGVSFSFGTATTLFARGGASQRVLTQAHIPSYSLNIAGLTAITSASSPVVIYPNSAGFGAGGTNAPILAGAATVSYTTTIGGSLSSGGGGGAHETISPFTLITWYIKLRRGTV